MSRFKSYWIWVDGKPGIDPHRLQAELDKDGEAWGRESSTWGSALNHLRRLMKKGYTVKIYERDA